MSPRRATEVMVERFDRNDILTYASAIAVQLLTAVIPLGLVAFLLVGVFGQASVWRHELGPSVADKASPETYAAIDTVVEGLISSNHTGWLVFGIAILIWEVSGAVRACMGALNRIFEREESRPLLRRFALSFGLGTALAVLVLGALLVTSRGGGWLDLGAAQPVWTLARWLLVVALLWSAVVLLFRFAPDGRQPTGWVTIGAVAVIVAWIAASLVFGWWIFNVANYRTAFGTALALVTLVGYLYTSAIIFLTGAQIDQLLMEASAA